MTLLIIAAVAFVLAVLAAGWLLARAEFEDDYDPWAE